jgi:hypothetical protein
MEPLRDDIKRAISSIEDSLREADSAFLDHMYQGQDEDDLRTARYYARKAFTQSLVLTDRLGLVQTHARIVVLLERAEKAPQGGLVASEMGPEEPYLIWPARLRMNVDAIADAYGLTETDTSALKDLKNAIRRSVYAICDTTLFTTPPANETDVHKRVEGILKCHYADLLTKPALAKPLKNFIPDSGIPSAKTLIEYKFATTKSEAKIIVDQVLADTQGYKSSQWRNLLIVVYETHRLFPEEDWVALLRQCGLGSDYDVVVLSGDIGKPKRKVAKSKKGAAKKR